MLEFLANPKLWGLLTFLCFVVFIGRPVWRLLIASQLDDRSRRIKDNFDEIAQLKEEADNLLGASKRQHKDAIKQSETIIEHAQLEAERLKSEAMKTFDNLIEAEERRATERIARAKSDAIQEIQRQVVQISFQAAQQILKETIKGKAGDALIETSIEDLKELDIHAKK
jgi:F-type H+-transporting ATPase subunit b